MEKTTAEREYLQRIVDPTTAEREYATMLHKIGILGLFMLPVVHIVLLSVLWVRKKKESPFVDFHGREVLRYGIFLILCALLGFVIFLLELEYSLFFYPIIFTAVAIIPPFMGAREAEEGFLFCYPFTLSPRKSIFKHHL